MSHVLLRSKAFVRSAKQFVKGDRNQAEKTTETLRLLAKDPWQPSLRTHKLKGKLDGNWACAAGYDLRILFDFVEKTDHPTILLLAVGTHKEVY
jgi:addiction module RelE/StbE family toxin